MPLKYAQRKSESLAFRDDYINSTYVGDNHGTLVNAPTVSDGLVLDGVDQHVTYVGVLHGIKSVVIKLKSTSTTEDIVDLDGGTHTIEATTGTISATGFASPTIYVDGVVSSTLDTNTRMIAVTTATAFDAANIDVGFIAAYFEGTIYSVSLFIEQLTAFEILDRYEEDTFSEIDESKTLVSLPLKSWFDDGTNEVTTNNGTAANPLWGDGAAAGSQPSLIYPNGAALDGDDYISHGTVISGVTTLSVSCLLVPGTTASNRPWQCLESGGSSGLAIYQPSGTYRILYNGGASILETGIPPIIGACQHLIVTVDWIGAAGSHIVSVYYNGALVASTSSATINNLDGAFTWGKSAGGWVGDLFKPKIFPFVLTATQAKEVSRLDERLLNK